MSETAGKWKTRTTLAVLLLAMASLNANARDDNTPKRVLLISVDGMHEQDVARCIGANTCPNLALLAKSGVTYTNAHTPGLSDSFPGLAALTTGGSPKTAGLFYDVSYDRTLYAPGDPTCSGKQGWNVVFDETTGIDAENGGLWSIWTEAERSIRKLYLTLWSKVFVHRYTRTTISRRIPFSKSSRNTNATRELHGQINMPGVTTGSTVHQGWA